MHLVFECISASVWHSWRLPTVWQIRRDGEWVFPEINARFERYKRIHQQKREASDKGEKKIAAVLSEVMELRNRQLALEVFCNKYQMAFESRPIAAVGPSIQS